MGGTHYFVLRQGGGRIFLTSLHFTTKKRPCLHYHNLHAYQHTRPAPYTYHKAMNRSAHNRVQQPTAKAHHRNSTGSARRIGHVPREISRVCWYFLARNNTITCKVTDTERQHSINIPGKGLEVPCMQLLANLGLK